MDTGLLRGIPYKHLDKPQICYILNPHTSQAHTHICLYSHGPYHALINYNKHTLKTNNLNDLWLILQRRSCQILLILHLHFTNGNRQRAAQIELSLLQYLLLFYNKRKRGGPKISLDNPITITVSLSRKDFVISSENTLNNNF